MKLKIIQLILILRLRVGHLLIKTKRDFEAGNGSPEPAVAADLNRSYGIIQGLLWVLRQMEDENFASLIETMGLRIGDEEITQLGVFDQLLEKYGSIAGEYAATAVKTREEDEAK